MVDLSTDFHSHGAARITGDGRCRSKQWTTTRPRDLPVVGRQVRLRWRKRRWYCPTAACPRKSFTEEVAQLPAHARLTMRLRQAAGAANRRWRPHDSAVGSRSRRPVAGRRGRVHRSRRRSVAGRAGTGGGTRHRRGSPWQALLAVGRSGRLVDHDRAPVARRLRGSVPAVKGCSPRSNAAPRRQSPAGWPRGHQPGVRNAKVDLLDLLDLLATARTQTDREHVHRPLRRFYTRCAASDPAGTAPTRHHDCDAHGFRNPTNQRLRTRTPATRRHRGHLSAA